MGKSARDNLERLREATESDSLADVVRKALTLLDRVVAEQSKGSRLAFKSPDGTVTEVLLL